MALDPRLADPRLLALAALRLKSRPPMSQMQAITIQVVYAAVGDEPAQMGPAYIYHVPTAPLDRAWRLTQWHEQHLPVERHRPYRPAAPEAVQKQWAHLSLPEQVTAYRAWADQQKRP